jgi:hypothetical protein
MIYLNLDSQLLNLLQGFLSLYTTNLYRNRISNSLLRDYHHEIYGYSCLDTVPPPKKTGHLTTINIQLTIYTYKKQ